jgi:hypothetical protein
VPDKEEKGQTVGETVAEEAKELAVEVYRDGAAPTVRAAGGILERIVKLAIRPLGLLVTGGERFMDAVEAKLVVVPPERLLPPPATVAAPAALQYALLGEDPTVENLRQMFEDLLVAAMDRDRASSVHPAFVTVISQLTADEAWMLKSVGDPTMAFPIIEARINVNPPGWQHRGIFFEYGRGIGIDESRLSQYLSNLERVGVLFVDWTRQLATTNAYDDLAARMRREVSAEDGSEPYPVKGIIEFTPFGIDLLNACVKRLG